MSDALSLRITTMLDAASAAGAGPSIPCDYRHDGTQNRTIFVVSLTATDSITIEASPDGTNWFGVSSAITTAGVTTITGPYPFLRANKTGTAGPATVVGVI